MKAICPDNPDHNRFITTAHVMEEWLVDENGDFLEVHQPLETSQAPNAGNVWTCWECGATATVQDT